MDYRLVATLGPRSDSQAIWQAMLAAGVDAFRLNTSHIPPPELQAWLDRLIPFLAAQSPRSPLVLDLQGSKWRLGQFPARELVVGDRLTLICAASTEDPYLLPVPHPDFFRAAAACSGEITLNDARVHLHLESQAADRLSARVVRGGAISSRKGITCSATEFRQERLSEADMAILAQTRHLDGLHYAVSYVRDANEMARYRAQVGGDAHLIAKLERQPAVDDAPGIAASADELWLCRGDLGAELGARAMAEAVYRFSSGVSGLPAPVLLAGQVFEHMVDHPDPTRSEVCAAYAALQQGYGGLVLSDETATGWHPIESCRAAAMFRL